jgi:hypothetical protein
MLQGNYQEAFHPEYWKRMTLDKRVQLLQDLENDQASKSGRSPYTIKAVPMERLGQCGSAKHDIREIHVNEAHIQHNNFEFVAIDTVAHEGRHAYQNDVIENRIKHQNIEQAQIWKENADVYVSNTEKMFLIYYNQPIERDAQDHAYNVMNEIGEKLEKKYGPIEPFQRYVAAVEKEARFVAEKARAKYGDEYILRIDKAIRDAYVFTKGHDNEKSDERNTMEPYLITVRRPGEEPLVKTVAVDRNLSQDDIRAFLKTEANDFINENVKGIDDLNGMSVHAEKAKDLSADQEKEFQNQVRNLDAEGGFGKFMEVTR